MKLPVNYDLLTSVERRSVREKYVQLQGGLCHFCQNALSGDPPAKVTQKKIRWALFPPNFLRYPVHLQHDHKTGLTEGAVHAYCNAVLWQYHGR